MYFFLLSLLFLCESTTFCATVREQSARGRNRQVMSLAELHNYIQHIELQKLEQTPCITDTEFAHLQKSYEQASKSAKTPIEQEQWTTKLTKCTAQLDIICAAKAVLKTLTSPSDIAAKEKTLWLSLRDFYEQASEHWSCYDKKAYVAERKQLQALYDARNHAELASMSSIAFNAEHKAIAATLLERLDAENRLSELKQIGSNSDLIRAAHLDLLNTYPKETPEHEELLTTILRNDLLTSIETLEDKSLSNEEYFTRKIALTGLLAQTYPAESTEHTTFSQDVALLKHLKNLAQLTRNAETSLRLPINEQNTNTCIEHFEALLRYTQYLNENHGRTYPIIEIEAQLEQLTNRASYYHHVQALNELEASDHDTRAEQCKILRCAIASSPFGEPIAPYRAKLTSLEKHLEKERLIPIINNIPEENLSDITTKIRYIRDELLHLNVLDANEQINWNKKLAQLYKLRNALLEALRKAKESSN